MECHEITNLISSYLDDELPLDIHFSVQQHLDSCLQCRKQFENEAALKQLLASRRRCYCVSPQFMERLTARLRDSKHTPPDSLDLNFPNPCR